MLVSTSCLLSFTTAILTNGVILATLAFPQLVNTLGKVIMVICQIAFHPPPVRVDRVDQNRRVADAAARRYGELNNILLGLARTIEDMYGGCLFNHTRPFNSNGSEDSPWLLSIHRHI